MKQFSNCLQKDLFNYAINIDAKIQFDNSVESQKVEFCNLIIINFLSFIKM